MKDLFDFFRREHMLAPAPRLLRDYKVGIVVSNQGLNDKQLAELSARLDFILKTIDRSGSVDLFVPGFNLANAEESVPREVRNLLERKRPRCQITYIPTRGDHKDGVAEHIHWELIGHRKVDEVWCCPAVGQTANSPARVAQVYRLGQASRWPMRFKMIPPWVEPPTPPENKQPKQQKGAKSWRTRKISFR